MGMHVAEKIISELIKIDINIADAKILIMGLTFKENCPDIRNSKAIDIITELRNWNIKAVIVDPWADPVDVQLTYGLSLGEISKKEQVDSLIVAVGHHQFRDLKPEELRGFCRGSMPVIADVKSIYDRSALDALDFSVFRL